MVKRMKERKEKKKLWLGSGQPGSARLLFCLSQKKKERSACMREHPNSELIWSCPEILATSGHPRTLQKGT